LAFSLDAPSSEVTVRLLDREGKLVRTIDVGARNAGTHNIKWDGRASDHSPLLSGNYRMQVRARDPNGAEISGHAEIRGRISQVDMEAQQPAVYLGDVRVPVGQLSTLHE
jgi:flagellar basal-body rod modification protein FlgD